MKEYYFKEINSTQDYAKELYLKNEEEFVVFSDVQLAGRGRLGRNWEAPLGGLWFSFDMEYKSKSGLFTIAIGVVVRDILAKVYNYDIKLKWPNDLILDNKKVGGILCEKLNDRVIVGIGINTNVENINEEKAVTFINKSGIFINNYDLMNRIISECKAVINEYTLEYVVNNFRKHMAFLNECCFVSSLKKEAKIIDIASNGNLVVEVDGEIKGISAGEINLCI